MNPPLIGVLGVVVLVMIMLTGIPVAFVFAVVGFCGFAIMKGITAGLDLLAMDFFDVLSSYNLTVIPLFVFMGEIAHHMGISQKLYTACHKLFGRVRGGLAMGTIAACAGFAACCGSAPASAATMGTVALPGMRRYGYADSLATGCVAAGGSLGILIPPSVIMIIYGILVEQSIAKLFVAGILPGIILSLLFIVAIFVVTTIHPQMGPAGEATTWREKMAALTGGLWETFSIFVLIMGGLFAGFFTPTEAGAVGSAGICLVAMVKRTLRWDKINLALGETLKVTAMILLIISGATVFGHFLAITRLPFVAADWVASLPLPRFLIMLSMIGVYLVGGCVMDGMALLMLTTPIFYPVSQALGYDPIWFGIIVVLVIEMACITPPVGINVYVIKGVAKDVPLEVIFKGIFPFLGIEILMVIILLIWPNLVLFLPNLMK